MCEATEGEARGSVLGEYKGCVWLGVTEIKVNKREEKKKKKIHMPLPRKEIIIKIHPDISRMK